MSFLVQYFNDLAYPKNWVNGSLVVVAVSIPVLLKWYYQEHLDMLEKIQRLPETGYIEPGMYYLEGWLCSDRPIQVISGTSDDDVPIQYKKIGKFGIVSMSPYVNKLLVAFTRQTKVQQLYIEGVNVTNFSSMFKLKEYITVYKCLIGADVAHNEFLSKHGNKAVKYWGLSVDSSTDGWYGVVVGYWSGNQMNKVSLSIVEEKTIAEVEIDYKLKKKFWNKISYITWGVSFFVSFLCGYLQRYSTIWDL